METSDPYRGNYTPLQQTIRNDQFDVAILLVESGANVNNAGKSRSPAELMLGKEKQLHVYRPAKLSSYKTLLALLKKNGAGLDGARIALNRGRAWGKARKRQDDLRAVVAAASRIWFG